MDTCCQPSILRDQRAFIGAEKALLLCIGLALVLLTGHLLSGGSQAAATNAKTTLETGMGSASRLQGSMRLMQAGEVVRPATWGRPLGYATRVRLQRSGAGQLVAAARPPIEPIHSTAPTDAALSYRGGKVVSSPKVVIVYWENGSNTVSSTLKDQLPGFYKSAVDSPYMDWLSEYDTKDQHIGRGTFAGSVTINPGHSSNSITNDDIKDEINKQIDAGNLPKPDENTIYMIHFPRQVGIEMDGQKSCEAFCAYHNTLERGGQSVYYGVMPDVSAGSQCAGGCGGAANDFDNQTSVASHELIETVTDPDVGIADQDSSKLGWYDDKYGEIGDICNAEQGKIPGTDYTVQKEWSNQAHGCIVAR